MQIARMVGNGRKERRCNEGGRGSGERKGDWVLERIPLDLNRRAFRGRSKQATCNDAYPLHRVIDASNNRYVSPR